MQRFIFLCLCLYSTYIITSDREVRAGTKRSREERLIDRYPGASEVSSYIQRRMSAGAFYNKARAEARKMFPGGFRRYCSYQRAVKENNRKREIDNKMTFDAGTLERCFWTPVDWQQELRAKRISKEEYDEGILKFIPPEILERIEARRTLVEAEKRA